MLEKMDDFFTARVDGYDEHNELKTDVALYKSMISHKEL